VKGPMKPSGSRGYPAFFFCLRPGLSFSQFTDKSYWEARKRVTKPEAGGPEFYVLDRAARFAQGRRRRPTGGTCSMAREGAASLVGMRRKGAGRGTTSRPRPSPSTHTRTWTQEAAEPGWQNPAPSASRSRHRGRGGRGAAPIVSESDPPQLHVCSALCSLVTTYMLVSPGVGLAGH